MSTLIEVWGDNASTILANSISSTSGTLNVASGTGLKFPTIVPGFTYFRLVLTPGATPNSTIEIVLVTRVVGDTFYITRAQEGTTAQSWAVGDIAFNAFSAGGIQAFSQIIPSQNNFYFSGVDTGTANAYIVTMNQPVTSNTLFGEIIFQAVNANTGASTLKITGGPTVNLIGESGFALQGGEIVAGSIVRAIYNGGSYVLTYASGGAVTTANATQSHQAIAWGQQGSLNVLHSVNADTATYAVNAGTAAAVPFIPTGTRMVFAQASVPTGWTRDVSDAANNRMMVIVNDGTGGNLGGSMSPTLMNVVPAHSHTYTTGDESNTHTHTLSGSTSAVDINHFHNGTTGGMNANNPHSHQYFDIYYMESWGNVNIGDHTGSHSTDYDNNGLQVQRTSFNADINHGHDFSTSYIAGGNNVPTHAHAISGSTATESVSHHHSGTTDNGSSQTNWAPRYNYMIIGIKS